MPRLVIFITFIAVLISGHSFQIQAKEGRHIILAFDLVPDASYKTYRLQHSHDIFAGVLEMIGKYDSLPVNEKDRFSIVKYGIGVGNSNLEDFAKVVVTPKGRKLLWMPYSEVKKELSNNWSSVINSDPGQIKGGAFSLLSGAKEYSLKAATPKDTLTASKVILINVTDNYYNGADDYHKEFGELKGNGSPINPEEFYSFKEDFWQNYHLNQLGQKILLVNKRDAPFQLLYNEVTSATPMPLAGAVDFPPGLNFERIRGGYRIDVDAKAVQDVYDISDFNVGVVTVNGDTLWAEKTPIEGMEKRRGLHLSLKIPTNSVDPENVTAIVTGDLHQRDDIYDAYVLSHEDKHYPRLTQNISLSDTNHAKVFGMPLHDWLWWIFPNDLTKAALVWEVVLIFILIGAIIYVLFRLNKKTMIYVPENNEISMYSMDRKLSGKMKSKR